MNDNTNTVTVTLPVNTIDSLIALAHERNSNDCDAVREAARRLANLDDRQIAEQIANTIALLQGLTFNICERNRLIDGLILASPTFNLSYPGVRVMKKDKPAFPNTDNTGCNCPGTLGVRCKPGECDIPF